MKKLLLALLLISCASTESGEWKEMTVSTERMDWRPCTKEFDGEEYHDKGWCWIGKEYKKKIFGTEYRKKQYFCAHGDMKCFYNYRLNEKILVHKTLGSI